jgi:hypothetical protein
MSAADAAGGAMGNVRWVPTDKHVFGALWREHHEALTPFGCFSNPDGTSPIGHGYPEMLTEWGFKGADYPIAKHHEKNGEHFYYLALVTKEDHL